jgi:predicted small lipoprotein YifL
MKKTVFNGLLLLALVVLVAACGNKGPLVKPEPAPSGAGAGR